MDYDLIVVKTLERVYKNYYYIIRGDARERRFLFYDYDEPTHFYEYMQTGYAGDVDTMYFTGVEITP